MSIVAISGAGILISIKLMGNGNVTLGMDAIIAIFASFISGWVAIAAMMRFLQSRTFTIFAIYRVFLGGGLLILLYTGVIG